ncbi:MAG: hypothetical protein AAFO09_06125, partial [Pseudomonadota bacterium]
MTTSWVRTKSVLPAVTRITKKTLLFSPCRTCNQSFSQAGCRVIPREICRRPCRQMGLGKWRQL